MRLGVEKGEAGREKEREGGEVKFEREQSLGQSRRIILKGKEVFLFRCNDEKLGQILDSVTFQIKYG